MYPGLPMLSRLKDHRLSIQEAEAYLTFCSTERCVNLTLMVFGNLKSRNFFMKMDQVNGSVSNVTEDEVGFRISLIEDQVSAFDVYGHTIVLFIQFILVRRFYW